MAAISQFDVDKLLPPSKLTVEEPARELNDPRLTVTPFFLEEKTFDESSLEENTVQLVIAPPLENL